MPQHLLFRLEAPLMSFGTLAVDANRPVQRWPAVSMLTGLLGNALGWRRTDGAALDRLQQRLRWAARVDRSGEPLRDFQTAQLDKKDVGWTTRGTPEGRDGGDATYEPPHIRQREYRADASVAVALRLEPADEAPTLQDLAEALKRPQRPLFVGRKSCAPSRPLLPARAERIDEAADVSASPALVDAADALGALAALAPPADAAARPAVFFHPDAVSGPVRSVRHRSSDERRFTLDVHAGRQTVHEWLGEPSPGTGP